MVRSARERDRRARVPRDYRGASRAMREAKPAQPPVVVVSSPGELQRIALALAPVGESLEKAPRFDDLLGTRDSRPDATQ